MSNSFILRPGQTVTVDFGAEPTPADFARLIAILELQRALAAGEPIEFDIRVQARPSAIKSVAMETQEKSPSVFNDPHDIAECCDTCGVSGKYVALTSGFCANCVPF